MRAILHITMLLHHSIVYILICFSSQCKRVSVKTGKRGKKKLKCRHEVIAAVFCGDLNEEPESVERTCKNCLKRYTEAGGQCKFCTTAVTYCSKKCQVNIYPEVPISVLCLRIAYFILVAV